ncbi:MAG: hypothetical protein NTV70_08850 [Acidobacteria bacterium]|nr:hypothetical protein [Acidobacteriota bacterium]
MPNVDLQGELLTIARAGVPENLGLIRSQLELLAVLNAQQLASLRDNTDALGKNTDSKGASSAGNTARTVASTFGAGLFLSPLISGLARLFGRGSEAADPELPAYARPVKVNLAAAVGPGPGGQLSRFDYDQSGTPRREVSSVSTGPSSLTQNVTIQIQALDSRSIMDRRDDIASAVREAMLQSHPLNDVVAEY